MDDVEGFAVWKMRNARDLSERDFWGNVIYEQGLSELRRSDNKYLTVGILTQFMEYDLNTCMLFALFRSYTLWLECPHLTCDDQGPSVRQIVSIRKLRWWGDDNVEKCLVFAGKDEDERYKGEDLMGYWNKEILGCYGDDDCYRRFLTKDVRSWFDHRNMRVIVTIPCVERCMSKEMEVPIDFEDCDVPI